MSDKRIRTEQRLVRLSPAEAAVIKEAALATDQPVATFIRRQALLAANAVLKKTTRPK